MRTSRRIRGRTKSYKLSVPVMCILLFVLLFTSVSIECVYIAIVTAILGLVCKLSSKTIHRPSYNMYYIDKMSGEAFEWFLKDLYRKKGYKVCLTPKTNDYGADLILQDGKEKTVLQAKRYKSKVGVRAVQEVIAAKEFYKADNAIVTTNSYFTSQAKELSIRSNVILVDRDCLKEMLTEQAQ